MPAEHIYTNPYSEFHHLTLSYESELQPAGIETYYYDLLFGNERIACLYLDVRLNGEAWLSNLYVERPYRQKGIATFLLNAVISRHSVPIRLLAQPKGDGGAPLKVLKKFYSDNGFIEESGCVFVRKPNDYQK